MPRITLEQAQAAKESVRRRFERLASVAGIGITRVDGEYAVKLNVTEPIDSAVDVPSEVDGVRLCVEVTGIVRPR